MSGHRFMLFLGLVFCGIAASQGIEMFVNRVLRPDAQEIAWISEVVLAGGFTVVTWLWVRLREARVALTDLERQQIVADTQLNVAARVQTSLLPPLPDPTQGINWCAAVEPAGKVGGDYYDFIALPDGRMCVVLGDVSGKGVAAAVFLANVRATLRALAHDATRPAVLLERLSSVLLADSTAGLYVTCIVAMVNPAERSFVYANAGHPAGVLWTPERTYALSAGGPPAGLLPDARFDEEALAFDEGDLVIFVSDGVTDALDASGSGSVNAIAAVIAKEERPTPGLVCAQLLVAARRGSGPDGIEGWTDDRTAVVFGAVATN
jgi:stage II sporulation SpoE-like protein